MMQTFLENLKDPGWLLGVVVVGLLLNLTASYIKSFLDFLAKNFFAKRFDKWIEKQAQLVTLLSEDTFSYLDFKLDLVLDEINSIANILMAILNFFLFITLKGNVLLQSFLAILFIVYLFSALSDGFKSAAKRGALMSVKRRKNS